MTAPLTIPPPIFTMGSALRWLGHECYYSTCCFASLDTVRAWMWFLQTGQQTRSLPPRTRVLVDVTDVGETASSVRRMLDHINDCTNLDAIEVAARW